MTRSGTTLNSPTDVAAAAKGVQVRGLRKVFGTAAPAIDTLDLDIAEGEFFVLLGPSGCGKTTTMRCVAGLETPTSGSISVGGRVVFDDERRLHVPANKRNIGMVFQSYAIWPHKTVIENVTFPLEVKKLPKADRVEQANRVLELVGLSGLGSRPASRLSGGQMQRVALARSLVMEPDVLLLDEPLSNLDAKLREHLRIELRELHQQLGITSIYVTHDLSEALALADRIAVLNHGRLEQLAEPTRLWREPASRFVADFLGMTNIFDAKVDGGGRSEVVLDGDAPVRCAVAAVPKAGAGAKVSVCARPETLLLSDANEWPTQPNVYDAVLIGSVFQGTSTRYHVKLTSGHELSIRLRHEGARWSAGAALKVCLPVESIIVLDR